jgi:hypothetical protein
LLRALPALFAGAGVYVTCLLAVELGGGIFAEILAAIAFAGAPVLLSFGQKVGPDMVGMWLWPLAALYVVRIVRGADPKLWLAAGACIGFALESKYSGAFFAVALVGGLLLTPQRRILRSRWFFAGVGLAAAIELPNFLWQALHGFPMWELLQNGAHGKNTVASPPLFLVQQLILMNLFVAPVWIGGLIWAFATKTARFFAWTYVLLIAAMIALHAKHYYPADIYPVLIAAGAVAWESWTRRATAARPLIAVAALAAAIFFAPLTLPVLAERQTVDYAAFVSRALHVPRSALKTERMRTSVLPEDFADMHGWPQLAATVAGVYEALPPVQRSQVAIVASNYGEAAAIDFFGPRYGLPPAISGHNNYWLWGTRGYSGNVVIDVNGDCGADSDPTLFRSKRVATRFDAPWVISYEHDIPIGVCTGITRPLPAVWPKLRIYI